MLQTLRDKSQGIVAMVIIGVIALTFALWGIHNYFGSGGASKPVAKVNGRKITEQSFNSAFQRFRQAHIHQNPTLFASQASVNLLKKRVLQSLVDASLLSQSATQQGFDIGEQQLLLALARLPAFQVNGQFSKMRFEQFLASMMFTQQQFLANLTTAMKLAQVRTGFVLTSFVLPYQINKAYSLINQKRTFTYVTIPTKAFLSGVKLHPNAVDTYYKQHQSAFTTPEKVSVKYIALSLPELMKKINPTPTQLRSYYENNINHFTIPKHWELAHILISVSPTADKAITQAAQKKAARIVAKLKDGKNFSVLASKYSDDLESAKQGGIMKPITLLEVDSTWQHQILALKNIGDLSAPFRTANGFEIVKLVKTIPAVVKPYDQVKAKVLENYRQEKAEKEFANLSDQLSNLTFEHPNTLKVAAKKLNLPIKTTVLFDKKGGDTKFLKNPELLQAAFSTDVLDNGNNSDAIQVGDQSIMILRLKSKVPSTVKPLANVRASITEKLKQAGANDLAKQEAQKIQRQVKAGGSLKSADHGRLVQTAHQVKRNNATGINPAIVATAFSMPSANNNKHQAAVTTIGPQGYAVVVLNKVEDGSANQMNAGLKREFKMGVQTELGEFDYLLYQQGLKKKATIKYFSDTK